MENHNSTIKKSNSLQSSSGNEEIIDLRELFVKYAKHWYWFVLAIIISLIIVTTYLKFSVNKYKVQTTILLRDNSSSALSSQLETLENFGIRGATKEVEDEIQILKSMKLMNQAIDDLGIQVEYYKRKKLKNIERYSTNDFKLSVSQQFLDELKKTIVLKIREHNGKYLINFKVKKNYNEDYVLDDINEPFTTPLGTLQLNAKNIEKGAKYKVIINAKKQLLARYNTKLNAATVNKQSNVIELSLVESNTSKSTDLLNKIVELYNQDAIDNKNVLAKNTADFIKDRLGIVTEQLSKAESNVESYKRSQNLTDISSEANIYLEAASDYNKKISELKTKQNLVESVQNYINNPSNNKKLIPVNVIADDPSLAMSIETYNKQVLERMQLVKTANSENPLLIQMDEQINVLKGNVLAGLKSSKRGLDIALKNLNSKNREFKSKIRNVPTQERRYIGVKRQQEIKQNIYLFLLKRQEDIALQLASTEPAARTIDRAYASLSPISPKKKILYLVALIMGLLIPFIIIYIIDLFDNKIQNKSEYRKLVKAPFLGSICISKEEDRVVVKENKTSPIIEMFSLIRTNLQFIVGKLNSSPVILLTSTVSGEGKSFTSINLSMSLALTNKKVVLIGLDIRNPMLNQYMKIQGNTGISLYLSGNIDSMDDLVVPSGYHSNFSLIPAGPIPPNPAELLMSQRLDDLIVELKKEYDYIIIDTAPVGVVTDTYLLDRVADMTVFVSRQGFTPKEVTTLVNEIVDNKKLKNISVVLNGTKENTEYGYTYGYREKTSSSYVFKDNFNDKLVSIYRKIFRKES